MGRLTYIKKLKTAKEVAALIGGRPRKRLAAMAHGVFDGVHHAHIRHLAYIKQKVGTLIVSITPDIFCTEKGEDRPHFPEGLRAAHLCALEIVDYVIIDTQSTPLNTIAILQPDYFAKGWEYQVSGLKGKTKEEAELVHSYGGEMLFTPGDFVLSSTKLLSQGRPDIRVEKLVSLVGGDFNLLYETLGKFRGKRIHVVGDTIVDSLEYGVLTSSQAKTPTISIRHESTERFVGGAAVVALHLAAAGAQVNFSTVIGGDDDGQFVMGALEKAGVDIACMVVDKSRPTTHKKTFVTDGYRLLRVNTVDNRAISEEVLEIFADQIRMDAEAVLFSDFRHGIFNRRSIPVLKAAIPTGCFCAADSQVASRWGNITDFKYFDLIMPNEKEARFALGDQDSGLRPLAAALYEQAVCKTMIMKLGQRGSLVCENGDFFSLDSFVDNLIDPVGAGDAYLAYASLGLLASRSALAAGVLGAMAAAVECERDGNVPVQLQEVKDRLIALEKEASFT